METVSAGSPSILTDACSFISLIQHAACAHKDMFYTKLPAKDRYFMKYS